MRALLRIRHPFFPGLRATPASRAAGVCAALSGTFAELVFAAEVGIRAQRAVFPVLDTAGAFLSELERDRLWDLFQVPVYAVGVDARGSVQAYECEAQNGMHVSDGDAPGALDLSPCECGRPGGRIIGERAASASESDAAD